MSDHSLPQVSGVRSERGVMDWWLYDHDGWGDYQAGGGLSRLKYC